MSIESDFFVQKKAVPDKLLSYGFIRQESSYLYSEDLLEGNFEAYLEIFDSGQLVGGVMDKDLQEEYLPLRQEGVSGYFVGQVREAYADFLVRIADACFEKQLFRKEQTNRLANALMTSFGDEADQPFGKLPKFTAFRHPGNQKWYGLVGRVKREKLDLGQEVWSQESLEEELEIINIKVDAQDLLNLLAFPSIYPAYHMSKTSWITIVMDEGLSDKTLFDLVYKSRKLVSPKTVINPDGPEFWIIPANMKNNDIENAFAMSLELLWKQKKSMKSGDYVLIYLTAPIKAIRYLCQVLEDHLPGDLMKVRLIKDYTDEELSFDDLKGYGIRAIRGPRRLTASLQEKIQSDLRLK